MGNKGTVDVTEAKFQDKVKSLLDVSDPENHANEAKQIFKGYEHSVSKAVSFEEFFDVVKEKKFVDKIKPLAEKKIKENKEQMAIEHAREKTYIICGDQASLRSFHCGQLTHEILEKPHLGEILNVIVAPEQGILITSGVEKSIKLWNIVATDKNIMTFHLFDTITSDVLPNSSCLAIDPRSPRDNSSTPKTPRGEGSNPSTPRDLSSGVSPRSNEPPVSPRDKIEKLVGGPKWMKRLVTDDENEVVVVVSGQTIKEFEVIRLFPEVKILHREKFNEPVSALDYCRESKLIAIHRTYKGIDLYDNKYKKLFTIAEEPKNALHHLVTFLGNSLLASVYTSRGDRYIGIYDLNKKVQISAIEFQDERDVYSFHVIEMDGKSVLVAGGCYELYFYDLTTFQKIKTFTVADGLTKMLVANIIRNLLALTGLIDDGPKSASSLQLFDEKGFKITRTFTLGSSAVNCLVTVNADHLFQKGHPVVDRS